MVQEEGQIKMPRDEPGQKKAVGKGLRRSEYFGHQELNLGKRCLFVGRTGGYVEKRGIENKFTGASCSTNYHEPEDPDEKIIT
jgi:hypothetical protein